MKKNLTITALLMVVALAGCQKDVTVQAKENSLSSVPSAKPPGSSTGSGTIYLSVEVDDASTNMIRSDDGRPYVHGTDRVEAQILSSDGNFYMNTNNNTTKGPLRRMTIDITQPGVTIGDEYNYSLRTTAPIWLQNMELGDANAQLVGFRVWGVQQRGVVDWRLVYRNGFENNTTSLTDYAKVTRVSNDVWTIEPAGYPGVTPANAALYNGDASVRLGYHVVPFKLTLTRR